MKYKGIELSRELSEEIELSVNVKIVKPETVNETLKQVEILLKNLKYDVGIEFIGTNIFLIKNHHIITFDTKGVFVLKQIYYALVGSGLEIDVSIAVCVDWDVGFTDENGEKYIEDCVICEEFIKHVEWD